MCVLKKKRQTNKTNRLILIDYGINSILFQRGIYPAESFENHQQYGLTILMSTDTKIKDFLKNVLTQTEGEFPTSQMNILFYSEA